MPDVDHPLPYKIAVLCYLYDDGGNVLLLHRKHSPNAGMYSPVGGKLDIARGEGPHECALREIREETGLSLNQDDLRLTGIVSERAYEGEGHWLIFLFEVIRPIAPHTVKWTEFEEGTLEWKSMDEVPGLPIPRTDREVMWPLVQAHRGGFFTVHIDWTTDGITWTVHESVNQQGTKVPRHGGTKGRV
ncbi:MAG: NUDIX domain-containing protein [Planctomycetes bacterium]|nr:NUDIX domain-containing protein [Planctomycetota bacterium]